MIILVMTMLVPFDSGALVPRDQYEYDDDDNDVDDDDVDDDVGVPFDSGALVPCDKPTLLLHHSASHRTANLNHFYTIF